MLRPIIPLTLLATLGVSTAQSQVRADPGPGALVAPVAPGSATVRIQTLAWTEISIPARLLLSQGAPPPSRAQRFVLTWQDLGNPAGQPTTVAVTPSRCTTMRLVLVPCD